MATDPFANLEEATESTTPTTKKKETTVSTTTDSQSKIVTTLKGGSGYDAPWIVIHTDTTEEALEILQDEQLKELIDNTKKVGAYFAGGSSKKSSGKPAGASQAPNGVEVPEGYVYKTGMGKNNRLWYAFMPAERNSGLDVIWLNADGSRR